MHVEGGALSVGLKKEREAAAMGDLSCKPWALQVLGGHCDEGTSEGYVLCGLMVNPGIQSQIFCLIAFEL